MRRLWLALIVALALGGGPIACVDTDEDETVPMPDWDFGKADGVDPGPPPAFEDPTPGPGETVTAARARALTAYAATLMDWIQPVIDETFRFRKLDGARLDETYRLLVDGGSCWSEAPRWGSNNDIVSDSDRLRMVSQVQFGVEFLRRFHEDANGQGNRSFDTVVICPRDVVGALLKLEGKTLFIGIDVVATRIQVKDAFALRSAWTAGEHLAANDPRRRVWPTIDPVGSLGIQLRDGIASAATYVGSRLHAVRDLTEVRLRADLRDLISAHVDSELEAASGARFRDEALARIETLSARQLRELATLWRDFVNDPDHHEGMKEAVLATHQATANKSYDVDVLQIGIVNVGNFHDIQVAVSLQLSRGREFVPYVSIEVIRNSIRVRQIGLVNVYTIDNVQVNLNVAADRGIETAGLRYALDRVP